MIKSNNLNIVVNGNLKYITFPKLSSTGIIKHTFSTRLGGVSTGFYSSMNLSFNRGDDRENVLKNYEILCSAVSIDTDNLVLSHQTHTNNVIIVDKKDCGVGITKPSFCDVDGLITNTPEVALVTQYADCTPLLFCDPVKKVIATSHAGWRGTVKLIGQVTIEKMVKEFDCSPEDIIVGIGPCIGSCCYEVDYPVYNEFKKIPFINLNEILRPKSEGKWMLDLVEANRQILINSGIKPENIDFSDICTCCNSDELHSHRATGGNRGNLAAIIQLK